MGRVQKTPPAAPETTILPNLKKGKIGTYADAPKGAKQKRFLSGLFAKCGAIGEAARLAKIDRSSTPNGCKDPEYASQFERREETDVAEMLVGEVINRAMYGQEEPVIYQGELQYTLDAEGNRTDTPLTIRRKSDVMLIFATKGARPDVYRDNYKADINIKADVTANHNLDLTRLTNEQLEALDALYTSGRCRRRRSSGKHS